MKQERSRVVLRIEEDGKKEVRKEANSRPYKKEGNKLTGISLHAACKRACKRPSRACDALTRVASPKH